jgi:cytochrome c553
MMKHAPAALAAFMLLCAQTPAIAADPAAGQAKSAICATCHGKNGIGTAPNFPNLAGQKAQYTAQQLKLFRSGERKSEQMNIIAQPLSDEDIANLAAYYESLSAGGS